MQTYQVTPKKDHYCRHFAEVISPSIPDERMTPPTTPQESTNNGWLGFLSSFGRSPSEEPETPAPTNPGGENDGLWLYLFPNNAINCYSPAFYTLRVVPRDEGHTILEYDIYGKKGAHPQEIDDFITFLKEVEQEDYDLCTATQKNLKAGVYLSGHLHPIKENGVLCKSR